MKTDSAAPAAEINTTVHHEPLKSWQKVVHLRRKGFSAAVIAGAMQVSEDYVYRVVKQYAPELRFKVRGKRAHNFRDLTGKRFGMLEVLGFSHVEYGSRAGSADAVFNVKCDCGVTTTKIGTRMAKGAVKSCGCQVASHRKNFNKLINQKESTHETGTIDKLPSLFNL